jgi:hypothetical protein
MTRRPPRPPINLIAKASGTPKSRVRKIARAIAQAIREA